MTIDVFRRYGNLLRPDGTNQLQRLLPALESDYIVPDERDLSSLIDYARRVAAEVRYYDLTGQATGDWQALLEPLLIPGTDQVRPTEELQLLLASRSDWPPHLVLFLVFLKLFQYLQSDLNELTQRHLLHYYENELGLSRREAAGDEVHVIFELALNAAATRLPAGTLLDAGKDGQGRALTYAMQNELVVSRAGVADLRRLVVDRDFHHFRRFFTAGAFTPAEAPGGFTFGRKQLDLDVAQRFMSESSLGFAVCAPILNLAEGERAVTMLAHLRLPAGAAPVFTHTITEMLEVAFSGAEGWIDADTFTAELLADGGDGFPALRIEATLGSASAAVIAADPALHGPGMASDRAAMRCLVRGESGLYEVFDGITVDRVEFDVTVSGIRNLVVQNDDSTLDPNAPMPLFGSLPRIGSAFYVGSNEAFSKRLTSLSLTVEWKAPPDDLFEHYRGYFDNVTNLLSDTFASNFHVDVALLYDRVFRRLMVNQPLFNPVPTDPMEMLADGTAIANAFAGIDYVAQPDLVEQEAFTAQSRFGFARVVLTGPTRQSLTAFASAVPFEAFGHPVFGRRYAVQAIKMSTTDPNAPLPSEPYTPELSKLSLAYRASAQFSAADESGHTAFQVIGPFGAIRARSAAAARLVPAVDGEAALLIGIRDLTPPGGISLLFEIDAGTATEPVVLESRDVEWSYLAANDAWRPFSAASVLIDTTQGFQKPGIVALNVPIDATVEHQSLPALVWLRALIRVPPGSAARTLSLRGQAAVARFDSGALPVSAFGEHLQTGLPAGTISKLVQRNPGIKLITQPNASFGGRGAEGTSDFIRRGSERLRHRNRGVTAWDLERLVLENFPEVFKVKCLPHTDDTGARRAGHTAVVVVPNLRRTGGSNVLEPRAGEVLLGQIDDYVAGLTTPFVTMHVIRPVFERIRVEAKVVFAGGRDPGYYANVLNEELRRFLSPWAFQEGEDILFGARIYRSDILAFIEGRDYVDHLVGLRIFHDFAGERREGIGWMTIDLDFIVYPKPHPGLGEMQIGDDFIVGHSVDVAQTTQAHAILVSHPEHLITPVAPGEEVCSGITQLGIGFLTVGLDFDVALEPSP